MSSEKNMTKISSALGIAVDFAGVYFEYKKGTNFCTYPRITYLKFLPRKVLRNGHWTNFNLKIWDFTSSNPNYSSRGCAKRALKIRNAVELVRFLKAPLNPIGNIEKTRVGEIEMVAPKSLTLTAINKCWKS